MTWYEDLRHIDWNGAKYTVLDKFKEEGRTYLGLAGYADVAEVAKAMDAGQRRSLPSNLTWVEEREDGFSSLSRKDTERILKRKSERATEAFRRK
jgi:hypothetical protein